MTSYQRDKSWPRHSLLSLTSAIILGAALSTGIASEDKIESETQPDSLLPEGEGRDLTIARCSDGCHDPGIVAVEGLSSDEWVAMIESMIGLGATISDEEFNTIYFYLTKAFPEN